MKSLIAILTIALSFYTGLGHAAESAAVISPRAHVTVITDIDQVQPGKAFYAGLRFQLTKGWHVYWLNSGDAGQPPSLHMKLPEGVAASDILWPTPTRLREGPDMVYAYMDDTTLPVSVSVPISFTPSSFPISIDADWLVCEEHCIPEKGHFDLSLPVGPEEVSAEEPLIEASLKRLPQAFPFAAHVNGDTLAIDDINLSAQNVQDAWVFPDKWGMIEHAAPQNLSFTAEGLALTFKPGSLHKDSDPLTGILVLRDKTGKENYYALHAAAASTVPASLPASWRDWLRLMGFALLGGLILNLMPCVFPVLAMKALSILHLSDAERRNIREHAVLYTLGVLAAFTVIAAMLLALRIAGHAVGWGFQFQSAIFVTFLLWLLFVIGLNMSGVFVFGTRIMGIGSNRAARSGRLGSFCTGLLAVVVATPCVAPFLGAAIAAALAAPAFGMFAIFMAMGFGLALPYVCVALFPGVAQMMPRPGAWMETLRQLLAFPMYGASAWLLWVLSHQDAGQGLVYALLGLVTLAFAAWLYGQVPPARHRGPTVRHVFLIVVMGILVLCVYQIANLANTSAIPAKNPSVHEEPYSAHRLADLREAGQPVLVDMTAAWCITCLVNERVAIMSDTVQQAFEQKHVFYLKGDWTQQDAAITDFLNAHNSDGVPLYVYYPANHAPEVVLPQILTPSIILDTVNQAKGE